MVIRFTGQGPDEDGTLDGASPSRDTQLMATGRLEIDAAAIGENWRALDAMSGASVETGATVKADGYGLGVEGVARVLLTSGARTFFVAVAEEGAALRRALGDEVRILVFSGHQEGDAAQIVSDRLIPLLNSAEQVSRHLKRLPDHPFGVQLDTGMNRLGMEAQEWSDLRGDIGGAVLVMSHLACADMPDHPMNAQQLRIFRQMTEGLTVPRSLAATGGILLGPEFHFDLTRPGIGLYGGLPFADAREVVRLSVPVIQTRVVQVGETVGYANAWTAKRPSRVATIAAGYADGLLRSAGRGLKAFSGGVACPVIGRVSMDLITVDVTDLGSLPSSMDIICSEQNIDVVAAAAGTIGYEVLTGIGTRYDRAWLMPH